MEIEDNEKGSLHSIAREYFSYLGRHLPQQCASDEFYFFPRSEAAGPYLHLLDDLEPDRLQDHLQYLKTLLEEIRAVQIHGPEDEIDSRLLRQSIKGLIREWGDVKVWQKDPTLYVKIPLFATARVLTEHDGKKVRSRSDLLALFDQIPSFLILAAKNLDSPSEISLEVALDMTRDAIHFHEQDIQAFIEVKLEGNGELVTKNMEVTRAWEEYGRALIRLPPSPGFAAGVDLLREILSVSLGYGKSPDEILMTAQSAHKETRVKLRALGREIDGHGPWTPSSVENRSDVTSPEGVVQLYRRQVQDLRRFFSTQDISCAILWACMRSSN